MAEEVFMGTPVVGSSLHGGSPDGPHFNAIQSEEAHLSETPKSLPAKADPWSSRNEQIQKKWVTWAPEVSGVSSN